MKQYFETSVYDKAYAYALDLAVSANIHIVKMNNNGEYFIVNETKVKDLTIEDLQHDIMRRYFYGQYSADDIFDYDSIIAEDVLLHCITNMVSLILTTLLILLKKKKLNLIKIL